MRNISIFFIAVATWDLQPKALKWLDAFNKKFTVRYESSVESIKQSINLIRDQGEINTTQVVKHIDGATVVMGKKLDKLMAEIGEKEDAVRGEYKILMFLGVYILF